MRCVYLIWSTFCVLAGCGSSSGASGASDALFDGDRTSGGSNVTAWSCVYEALYNDGWDYYESNDDDTQCFSSLSAATAYTDAWTNDCFDTLQGEGWPNIDCYASCDNTFDTCN